MYDPEGEDDEAGDDENDSKHGEDEVAGFFPACVVKHFGWLHEIVCGVVDQHDQSPSSDVVDQPGEADEEDGRHMVNYLFFEILPFDIRRYAENQWEIEAEFDHVVPVLGR